jgi:hypothetical protein
MNPAGANEQTNEARDEACRMLEQLRVLLERQLELVHRGGLTAAEELSGQADQLVREVAAARVLDAPQHRERRRALERLYRELCMTLTVQRQETFDARCSVQRGRRMLRTYGNYVSRR